MFGIGGKSSKFDIAVREQQDSAEKLARQSNIDFARYHHSGYTNPGGTPVV